MKKVPFLTARWEYLLAINFQIDPEILAPLVPHETELDPFQGKHFVSLVGFRFLKTKVLGFGIPGHVNFDEVNLRFYVVRRLADGTLRRGVVFIRELVPRWAIATVAKIFYNEPYQSLPMRHKLDVDEHSGGTVEYGWKHRKEIFWMNARVAGAPREIKPASSAEYILEHYWGYTIQRNKSVLEYQIEHPPWKIWEPVESAFHGNARELYGEKLGEVLSKPPASTFMARGSDVMVYKGMKL